MIRRAAFAAVLLFSTGVLAEEPPLVQASTTSTAPGTPAPAAQPQIPAGDLPVDTSIERSRTPFEVLSERSIGSASRAVRYDWRTARFGFAGQIGQLLELNNFVSTRVGVSARMPMGGVLGELALSRVFTMGTDSSDKLALTPYRQSGRPSRWELDANLAFPVAEGVATARGIIPATELVLFGIVGLRYRYFDGELAGLSLGDGLQALVAPTLSQQEIANLEGSRLPGMAIDGGRYGIVLGGALDIYFQSGLLVTPRLMVSPFSWSFTSPGIGWWWELTFSLGTMIK